MQCCTDPKASNTQQLTSKFKAKFSETRQILSPTKAPKPSTLCLGGYVLLKPQRCAVPHQVRSCEPEGEQHLKLQTKSLSYETL